VNATRPTRSPGQWRERRKLKTARETRAVDYWYGYADGWREAKQAEDGDDE
jgi:hypothetical protein